MIMEQSERAIKMKNSPLNTAKLNGSGVNANEFNKKMKNVVRQRKRLSQMKWVVANLKVL